MLLACQKEVHIREFYSSVELDKINQSSHGRIVPSHITAVFNAVFASRSKPHRLMIPIATDENEF